MLRRNFVAASGGLCLAPAATAFAAGQSSGRKKTAPVLRTIVTNLPATLPAGVTPGTRLTLKRAYERAYDPRSIAAFTSDGERLGYLPGRPLLAVSTLMDQGFAAEAVIVACRQHARPTVTVDIMLSAPEALPGSQPLESRDAISAYRR